MNIDELGPSTSFTEVQGLTIASDISIDMIRGTPYTLY